MNGIDTAIDRLRKSATQSSPATSQQSSQVADCIKHYGAGNGENFLRIFSPQFQSKYCLAIDRAFTGHAPTIETLRQTYGSHMAETWIECQIKEMSEYTGCKDKMSVQQTEDIAKIILAAYPFLKATEIMLFFWWFKAGRYGRFYGAVDAMVITTALRQFQKDRRDNLARIENERQKTQRDTEDKTHKPRVDAFRAKCKYYGVDALTFIRNEDIFNGYIPPDEAKKRLRNRQCANEEK